MTNKEVNLTLYIVPDFFLQPRPRAPMNPIADWISITHGFIRRMDDTVDAEARHIALPLKVNRLSSLSANARQQTICRYVNWAWGHTGRGRFCAWAARQSRCSPYSAVVALSPIAEDRWLRRPRPGPARSLTVSLLHWKQKNWENYWWVLTDLTWVGIFVNQSCLRLGTELSTADRKIVMYYIVYWPPSWRNAPWSIAYSENTVLASNLGR